MFEMMWESEIVESPTTETGNVSLDPPHVRGPITANERGAAEGISVDLVDAWKRMSPHPPHGEDNDAMSR